MNGTRGDKPIYAYFGHHKCGTRWIAAILQDVCDLIGLKLGKVNWQQQAAIRHPFSLQAYVDHHGLDFIAHINANYRFVPSLQNLRGVHVVRDPRDVCVSAYYSHLHSHPIRTWKELGALREQLQVLPKNKGLLLDMQFSKWIFDDMRSWRYDNPAILETNLETAANSPYESFEQILSFMGLFPDKISMEQLREIVDRHNFRNLSGGRQRGEEDVLSHYRKGQPGDWRAHFEEMHVQYFRQHYDQALHQAGYSW